MYSGSCKLQYVQILHNDFNFLIYNNNSNQRVDIQDILCKTILWIHKEIHQNI